MIKKPTREAILELHEKGLGTRTIKKLLKVSRDTVRDVIKAGIAEVPVIERPELPAAYHDHIVELYVDCEGQLGRVHEELCAKGADFGYSTLTAYCRRHEIGKPAKPPSGRYEFAPGKEMQHDTSPYHVSIAGKRVAVQIASLVMCFSRKLFFQFYLRFRRFECKVFLTRALKYFGGSAEENMIDNTHVIVLSGTGANMVPVPEMETFGERFGFAFKAHEVGDSNRSARVEGHFKIIKRGFLPGRKFESLAHLNQEAEAWCDKMAAKHSRKLGASRNELFAMERHRLHPLPLWVPEPYLLHSGRMVDEEGYVHLETNRYSVPYKLAGRKVDVREHEDRIVVSHGTRDVAEHPKVEMKSRQRRTCKEHRPPRGEGPAKSGPPREEVEILRLEPRLASYVTGLRKRAPGRGSSVLRRLLKMLREFPREPFVDTVAHAENYGLYDLNRLERLVLRHLAGEYFTIKPPSEDSDDE